MFAVVEHVGGGGVDGNSTGIGGEIGGLLTYMELKRFKFIICHDRHFLSAFVM